MFSPPGPGPFPLAVLNHGATHISAGNRGDRYRYTYSAYYFLSRGYAVAMPMARGFAQSGGEVVHDGCALDRIGRMNAAHLTAVIDAVSRRPEIDRNRIVVGGQSFGGWTTLAYGENSQAGGRGLIGLSPALRVSDCDQQDQAMIDGAGKPQDLDPAGRRLPFPDRAALGRDASRISAPGAATALAFRRDRRRRCGAAAQ